MPGLVDILGSWTALSAIAASIVVVTVVVATRGLPMLAFHALRLGSVRRSATSMFHIEGAADYEHLSSGLGAVASDAALLRHEIEATSCAAGSDPTRGRSRWLQSWLARGQTNEFESEIRVVRRVWDWVEQVESLPATDLEQLRSTGVSPAAIRRNLVETESSAALGGLVGLLRQLESGLAASGRDPYRDLGAELPAHLKDLAAAASGSRAQREKLFFEVTDKLAGHFSRLARSYARTDAGAEDLRQDILTAIWRALPSYRGDAPLRAFVLRVAYNRAVSFLRRELAAPPKGPEIDTESVSIKDPMGAEEVLDAVDQREALRRAVANLRPGLREVMIMHLEGLSYREIAEVVGITEKNVSARLTRGRAALRTQLGGSAA